MAIQKDKMLIPVLLAENELFDASTALKIKRTSVDYTVEPPYLGIMTEITNRLINYVNNVKKGIVADALTEELVEDADDLTEQIESITPEKRETAFKCVSSYKSCKAESKGIDRILCGIALAICWAKEIVPLIG